MRLRQLLVEPERAGGAAADLRPFQAVREAGAVVVALVVHEDLRLVLEAAEGRGVDDAVAVALVAACEVVLRLRVAAPAAVRAAHPVGREGAFLALLQRATIDERRLVHGADSTAGDGARCAAF